MLNVCSFSDDKVSDEEIKSRALCDNRQGKSQAHDIKIRPNNKLKEKKLN